MLTYKEDSNEQNAQIKSHEYYGESKNEEKYDDTSVGEKKDRKKKRLKSQMVNGYEPLHSEGSYSEMHNKGYVDFNGLVSSEQKKSILDNNMIMTIICFVSLIILLISCFCYFK